MSETRITKSRHLLEMSFGPDIDADSALYNPGPEMEGDIPELMISGDDYRALGEPEQITVTIEAGDLLNVEEPSLNDLPEETLIRATGAYPGGGTFTDCWARPVPEYVSGAPDGSDRLWEVLVFGSGGIDALTTTACITSFEVLHTEATR